MKPELKPEFFPDAPNVVQLQKKTFTISYFLYNIYNLVQTARHATDTVALLNFQDRHVNCF